MWVQLIKYPCGVNCSPPEHFQILVTPSPSILVHSIKKSMCSSPLLQEVSALALQHRYSSRRYPRALLYNPSLYAFSLVPFYRYLLSPQSLALSAIETRLYPNTFGKRNVVGAHEFVVVNPRSLSWIYISGVHETQKVRMGGNYNVSTLEALLTRL